MHLLDYGVTDRLRITLDECLSSSLSLSVFDVIDKLLILDVVLATRDDVLGGEEGDVNSGH